MEVKTSIRKSRGIMWYIATITWKDDKGDNTAYIQDSSKYVVQVRTEEFVKQLKEPKQ